jgi:thiosulfate/3-mercaptopyruvate sulfurtransferase
MAIRAGAEGTRWALAWALALGVGVNLGACNDSTGDDKDDNGGEGGDGPAVSGGRASTSGGASHASGGKATSGGSGGNPSTDGGNGGDPNPGGAPGGGSPSVSGGAPSGGADTGSGGEPAELFVATPEDLTDESEVDYADNEHGIITGGRLNRWINDWSGKKPEGIDGRLIILQVVPQTVTSFVNIAANEEAGVFSYLVGANSFNSPRDNGYSAFETDIPDGTAADAWFKKYAIDPREDLIVLTFEQQSNTANSIVQSIGRAWIFFKYWGVDVEHLAILNGSINYNASTYGFDLALVGEHTFSDPPNNGTVTVRDLGVDNTILSVPLEELITLLEARTEPSAPADDGTRIVDARGGAEAYGLLKATSTGRTTCTSYTGTGNNAKCSTPFEGRLRGAKSVPWPQFLDTAPNGFRFLPKSAVKSIFDAQSGWNAQADLTIQYCRTNQRSTVTGIVANTILGYPTRFYETSFIEWGHSSAGPDEGLGGAGGVDPHPNTRVVAPDFPFRTDLDYLTEHAVLNPADSGAYVPGGTLGTLTQPVTWVAGPNYNIEADIAPPVPGTWPKLNPEATTTRLSIDQDRAYLRDIPVEELP